MSIINKLLIDHNIQMKNRDLFLDFIRGSAMILVLMHHCHMPFNSLILLFHMPLFFILSGYTNYSVNPNYYKQKSYDYIYNKIKKLLIPYLLFEIINAILSIILLLIKGRIQDISISSILFSIVTCINTDNYPGICLRLWFLPCIFISSIILFFILKKADNRFKKIICLVSLIILSYLTTIIGFRLPFTIDISLLATAYMLIGYMLGSIVKKSDVKNGFFIQLIIVVIGIIICFIIYKFLSPGMLMYINQYGNYIPSILLGFIASVVFMIISSFLYNLLKKNIFVIKTITWYSQNSLATFPVHLQIIFFLTHITTILTHCYILFPLTFLLNIIVVNIINNYMPFLIQKNK